MTKRKGFSLIELMVVVGIILTLATLLLVGVNHARRSANIAAEQLDFQAIAAALENYKHDFGAYPKNLELPLWNTSIASPPAPAPPFLSLAAALLGPGPGSSQMTSQMIQGVSTPVFTAGDGLDGPGIRTQAQNIPASLATTTITFNSPVASIPSLPPSTSLPAPPLAPMWFDIPTTTSPSYMAEQIVGITSISSIGTTSVNGVAEVSSLTVTWGVTPGPTGGSGVLRIATGKSWGPYLPPDRFQVTYVDPLRAGTSDTATNPHYPVLLDRWGGMIQYFPAYGPNSNRLNESSYFANYRTAFGLNQLPLDIIAGPLFGFSAPEAVDTTTPTVKTGIAFPYGSYSIYDQRDGAPVPDSVSPQGTEYIPWHQYTYVNARPIFNQTQTDLSLAVKWMLGDDNMDNFISSATGETLRSTAPYILISAGPDGPNRSDAGFCDFDLLPSTSTPAQYQAAFTASGNIYNFDRQ